MELFLRQLISQGEGKHIEFKSAKRSVPSDLCQTVVSFSNTKEVNPKYPHLESVLGV